jgi:hypothetical protein
MIGKMVTMGSSTFIVDHFLLLILAAAYPIFAAKKDHIQIEANGSFDSLKSDWHKINVYIRVLIFGVAAALPVQSVPTLVVSLAYLLFSSALHWLIFDYVLNKLRGLDPWYQGQNAESDKYATPRNKYLVLGITGLLYLGSLIWALVK